MLNQRIWEIREEFDTADTETIKYRQGYIQALKDVLEMDSEGVEG